MKPYYQESIPGGRTLTIYHGDNREVLPELGIYDLVLTDPPYGVGLEYDGYKDNVENLCSMILNTFPLIRRSGVVTLLTPGNKNQYYYPDPDWTLAWFCSAGVGRGPWGFTCWQPILAFGKDPHLREQNGSQPDALFSNDSDNVPGHPCPKPLGVWSWLMKRGASRQSDRILDPFLGSGTTLLCAKELGHEAVGIEQSERYCEIAAKRLTQGVLF